HDFLKLSLLIDSLRVDARSDGSLQLSASDRDSLDSFRAVPIGVDLWQSEREERHVAALRGPNGAVEHLAIDAMAFDRVSFWNDPELHKDLLAACAVVFAGTLLGWGIGALARATGRQPPSPIPRGARAIGAGAAALSLATLLAVGIGLGTLS